MMTRAVRRFLGISREQVLLINQCRLGSGATFLRSIETLGSKTKVALPVFALLLIGFSAFLNFTSQVAYAKPLKKLAGQMTDVEVFEDEHSLQCTSYQISKQNKLYISKIDGTSLFGKRYWTARTINQKRSSLLQIIQGLGKNKTSAAKKSLKKAKKDSKVLTTALKMLRMCADIQRGKRSVSPVVFEHVKGILSRNCMACHITLSNWQNTEEDYINKGLIEPGDLAASPLYTYLSNIPDTNIVGPKNMPKGLAALEPDNLELIRRYIAGLGDPDTTPGGDGDGGKALYKQYCASCHGAFSVSAIYGKSEAAIRDALSGRIPEMAFLRNVLTSDQIHSLAVALANVHPKFEGTINIKSLGDVSEGNPGDGQEHKLQFQISLTGSSSQPFQVGYVTVNGSALAGSDYQFVAGTVQFAGTKGESHTIEIPIVPDIYLQADKSLSVSIGNSSYGPIKIGTSSASAKILNDDAGPPLNPIAQSDRVLQSYNFNTNFRDSLGLSDAVPQGNPTISGSAKVGLGALSLASATDFLKIPFNAGAPSSGSGFTVATWFNWQNATSTTAKLFDLGSTTASFISFSPGNAAKLCTASVQGAGTAQYALACPAGKGIQANTWTHMAMTYDAATAVFKLYVNGVEIASRRDANVPLTSLSSFGSNFIGNGRVAGQSFLGSIDEFTVWNVALDPGQIREVSQMDKSAIFTPGLEVSYNGQSVLNRGTIDLGEVSTGSTKLFSLLVKNKGQGWVDFSGSPVAVVAGKDSALYSVAVQPMPWQSSLGMTKATSMVGQFSPRIPGDATSTMYFANSEQGFFAVQVQARVTGEPLSAASSSGTQDAGAIASGRSNYALNCAACHGAIDVSTKRGMSEARLVKALDPKSGPPQMSGLATSGGITSQMIKDIALALSSIGATTEKQIVADYTYSLGTASQVASTFKDIFLPPDPATYTAADTQILTVIKNYILGLNANNSFIANRVGNFGGGCQPRFDPLCQAEQKGAFQQPLQNIFRSAQLLNACWLITSSGNRAIDNVLSKVALSRTSAIDSNSVKALYSLFMPGRDLPTDIAVPISTFVNQAPNLSSADKQWAHIVNFLCTQLEGL